MSNTIRILGLAGSLRRQSYNRAALRAAMNLVPANTYLEPFELDNIPIYDQDEELNPPAPVIQLKRRIREADAVLLVTPEYNHSVTGLLKNAIDWASRPYGESAWDGKPAAIMGATPGAFGTARAQGHLRQILSSLGMAVLNQPEVLIGNAATRFDPEGILHDEATRDAIRQLLTKLVDWTRRLQPH
jgi:chromate reductase